MVILGFLTIPWLGPKDTEPRAISVPGEARTHGTACAIGPKGEARTHRLHAPSVSKAKLGYLNYVCYVLEFCTLGEGGRGSCKVVMKTLQTKFKQ